MPNGQRYAQNQDKSRQLAVPARLRGFVPA
jgi:hypothetical protein